MIAKMSREIPRPSPGSLDVQGVSEAFAHRMMYSVAKDAFTATDYNIYHGLAFAVRDRLMERWFATQDRYYRADAKRIYYLSLEFLMGRALRNNIENLKAGPAHQAAMAAVGYKLEEIETQEWDAGLGNGGLGRLAACFLDSAATLGLPFYGYGIRYEYGIFHQHVKDGFQVEAADNWLRYGNPWEIPRPDSLFPVNLYGRTERYRDEDGSERVRWVDTASIYAMAYDTPIAGYGNDVVNSLRLWSAKSTRDFDLSQFNSGNYVQAVEEKSRTENISKVLYPPDDHYEGKELRLKQQYFFVSATLQDVIRRFKKRTEHRWHELPEKAAIQLNDTHPTVAIPELMRILMDEERQPWDLSWSITQQVFGFTNHTVLPEALETWPLDLFGRLLPRHLEIIEEIDRRFRDDVRAATGDEDRVSRMALLSDGEPRVLRMAHLAIVGSHKVNGVARIHSDILKAGVFRDFHELFPGRFTNKTNGVTPRRWLLKCNPPLAALVTEAIGDRWVTELDDLRRLAPLAGDAAFRERWVAVKMQAKRALAVWLHATSGLAFDPEALLDGQVKRIHEYKRQLLNVLHVLALRDRIRDGETVPPRTVLFGGKAAPGYRMAKLIVKLIHVVADLVARDPAVSRVLKVVFVPNYNVSAAELIFPACELSEQISTAGTEASGTGNMKAALNGAVTIGTLDGANVEIRDEVGADNILIFGHTADGIAALKARGAVPAEFIAASPRLQRVLTTLSGSELSPTDSELLWPVVDTLLTSDRYFHAADFESYLSAQRLAEALHGTDAWTRMSILNVAGMGPFSSDRTVREYAQEIWGA